MDTVFGAELISPFPKRSVRPMHCDLASIISKAAPPLLHKLQSPRKDLLEGPMKDTFFGIPKSSFFLSFSIRTLISPAKPLALPAQNAPWRKSFAQPRWAIAAPAYAWESTASGQDVTPSFVSISGMDSKSDSRIPIFTGTQELHITADIAWAVYKYWDATLDHAFMCDFGVEILIETARFWSSRVVLYGDRYHLKEVVGPDEYHNGVTDNAFTNWMVRFNLEMAIKMVSWLADKYPKEFETLSSRLNLSFRRNLGLAGSIQPPFCSSAE